MKSLTQKVWGDQRCVHCKCAADPAAAQFRQTWTDLWKSDENLPPRSQMTLKGERSKAVTTSLPQMFQMECINCINFTISSSDLHTHTRETLVILSSSQCIVGKVSFSASDRLKEASCCHTHTHSLLYKVLPCGDTMLCACETGWGRTEEPVVTAAALRSLHLINQHSTLPWGHCAYKQPPVCNRIYPNFRVAKATSIRRTNQLQTTQWPQE